MGLCLAIAPPVLRRVLSSVLNEENVGACLAQSPPPDICNRGCETRMAGAGRERGSTRAWADNGGGREKGLIMICDVEFVTIVTPTYSINLENLVCVAHPHNMKSIYTYN